MGLRQSDLEFTVVDIFQIDPIPTKMGDDEDIVTLSSVLMVNNLQKI